MAGPPVTNRQRETMRRLREQGLSLEEIAAQVGRSGRCVLDHVGDMNVRCRSGKKGLGPAGYARLLTAAENGVPRAELAARFGLAESSASPTLSRLRRTLRTAAGEACAC